MTLNTDYTVYLNPAAQTVAGLSVKLYHFSITAAGSAKITNKITNDADLLIPNPFWTWNDVLSKRSWMGPHYTAHNFENEPDDWATALYWKYYLYTADTNFEQYKTVPATFNSGNTYYTCDAPEYAPQRIYYADNDHASSFVIGQFVGAPPAPNTWFGYGSGGVCNGVPAVAGIGGASGTSRSRIFAAKSANDPYTGYAGMTQYSGVDPVRLVSMNTWVLTGTPAQNIEFKTYCQLAHITYGDKEYIGWGTIFYDPSNPNTILYSNFTCVNIECFTGAILPDTEPYSSGTPAGNPGGQGGYGSGLPDGDNFGPSLSGGGLTPLGYGVNAYQITNSDIGVLTDYLWGRSGGAFNNGGLWDKFKNYKFNPIAGILSVHHIPYELQPTVGTSAHVKLAGMVFDGVESGGVTVSGNPITAENHIAHFSVPTVYLDHEHGELPYFSFEDFARTRVRVYLPYCGTVELDPASCIGGAIEIDYQCDCVNGNVGVQITTTTMPDKNGNQRRHVSAVATGNCAYKIPMTGNDNGTGEILGAITGAVGSMMSGNFLGALGAGMKAISGIEQHHTITTGDISGNAGFLTSRTVIVEVTYGDYYRTDGQYPAMMMRPAASSGIVSDFTGHSQLIVHADSISIATDAEREEIETMCRNGVLV